MISALADHSYMIITKVDLSYMISTKVDLTYMISKVSDQLNMISTAFDLSFMSYTIILHGMYINWPIKKDIYETNLQVFAAVLCFLSQDWLSVSQMPLLLEILSFLSRALRCPGDSRYQISDCKHIQNKHTGYQKLECKHSHLKLITLEADI